MPRRAGTSGGLQHASGQGTQIFIESFVPSRFIRHRRKDGSTTSSISYPDIDNSSRGAGRSTSCAKNKHSGCSQPRRCGCGCHAQALRDVTQ